jgi:hypothetical protein
MFGQIFVAPALLPVEVLSSEVCLDDVERKSSALKMRRLSHR